MASMSEIEDFLNGALVSWLESCLPRPEILSGYSSLLDGSIIHSVWLQIDPEPQHHLNDLKEFVGVQLCGARAKNFDAIIRNLKLLYEEELGQTILILPDCSILGYSPETRAGLEQMKILLVLLLGAAVQCPNKEIFIARIKELDVDTQHGIVELIKMVTDNHSLVLTQESLDVLTPATMYNHILRLTKERDSLHFKLITSLTSESENPGATSDNSQGTPISTPGSLTASASSTESNHMAVELADLKSKLRKIRQELEEKSEAYMEVKEEFDHKVSQYEKLRNESQEWYSEAKRAAAYRDEVDVLRERADRADRLEIEVQKFREKLSDADFYKTRVEELREDNRMLLETKEMLEDQLQRSRKRSEHVMSLESEIIKYKRKINDMALERDVDKTKLQELLEENTQLQLVAKNLNVSHDADRSMSENEDECNSGDNSLSEQLTNNAQTRVLKLELENRKLLAALDQLKESSFHELTNKILELEKEKKKLSLKFDQIQDNSRRLAQQNKELEDVFKNALEENKKLQDTLDLRQKAHERQSQDREIERSKIVDLENYIETLNKDKQRLQTLCESIQRRAEDVERLLDSKTKEVDSLQARLTDFDSLKKQMYELQSKSSTAERENVSLTKEVARLKENLEAKAVQLDESILTTESQSKEIQRMQKELLDADAASLKIHELEQQNQELVSQRKIDSETIATLQKDLVTGTLEAKKFKTNLEKLGLDNTEIEDSELKIENVVEKLVKNPETFKTVCEVMLSSTKQNAKSDMCVLCHRKEIFTVEKNIELSGDINESQNDRTKEDSSATAKWKEQCDQLNATNLSLQNENEALQAENARQGVDVATLGSKLTSLNTQLVTLQLANSQLAADKDMLLKKVESIKQENKNLLHDQVALQCYHEQLSSDYEALNKDKESLKSMVRDLRSENRDLKERAVSAEKSAENLKSEMTNVKSSSEDLAILRAEHSKLTEDFRNLFSSSERLKTEYKNMQDQYKIIRAENSRLKLENTQISGDLNSRRDLCKSLEIELTKVAQQRDMLLEKNSTLDIDRRTLMDHVSQLLTQYHELLAHSLEDKQHYHDEEKNYTDKLNSLNRQKEKLEEKIMEHYRKLDSCTPKKKAFGSSIVKRVKKVGSDIISKVPSRNRRSWIEDSRLTQSQVTLGSESGGNESDNSTEEPNSVASDSNLIQRNAHVRQSLQRKPNELKENHFLRGGVRSSLQTLKRDEINNSRRNSVHGLEAPDVTGSSLTLGTAGSRRTVYLVDENQKIPDNKSPNASEAPTPTNSTSNDTPPTLLMYNRINTTIVDGNSSGTAENTNLDTTSNNGDKTATTKKRTEDKSNTVWYEYGCV